jgi:hypothetical protein
MKAASLAILVVRVDQGIHSVRVQIQMLITGYRHSKRADNPYHENDMYGPYDGYSSVPPSRPVERPNGYVQHNIANDNNFARLSPIPHQPINSTTPGTPEFSENSRNPPPPAAIVPSQRQHGSSHWNSQKLASSNGYVMPSAQNLSKPSQYSHLWQGFAAQSAISGLTGSVPVPSPYASRVGIPSLSGYWGQAPMTTVSPFNKLYIAGHQRPLTVLHFTAGTFPASCSTTAFPESTS